MQGYTFNLVTGPRPEIDFVALVKKCEAKRILAEFMALALGKPGSYSLVDRPNADEEVGHGDAQTGD